MEAEYEAIERRVVDTFPYPVAVNLAYARRARQAHASDREFHHLLATYEALIHLLASVCLLDLVSPRSTPGGADDLEEVLAPKGTFTPNLDRPTNKDWNLLIAKCLSRLEQPFLREMRAWTKAERKDFNARLDEIREIRNRASHPHPRPSLLQAQRELQALWPALAHVLRRLEFLGNYTLLAAGCSNDDGQVLVTRLRGSSPPVESHWLEVTDALKPEDIALVDPEIEECLRLRPFYLAIEGQDDVDRIWAFNSCASVEESRYYVVDRASNQAFSPTRRIPRPSDFLRTTASSSRRSPRVPLKASQRAKEELGAHARPSPELGHIVGIEDLERLPGSMSLVYEGRVSEQPPRGAPAEGTPLDLPTPGTKVVVKAARQGDAYIVDNQCIAAEFELLASITSRHVPRAYGLLVDGQGRNYLVLEHREGDRLSARLQSLRVNEEDPELDLATAVRIADQLVTALADVHRHGFHGDLKPSNILVSANDDVSLIDFGAGRLDDDLGTEMIPAFGTRGYVAPELFMPGDDDPDRKQSDLYSLAIVLYELFTGHLPKLDSKREGLDVSSMPGPRVWRLIVRWCGLVDPELRLADVSEIVQLLGGRAKVPSAVDQAVPYRSATARFWNIANILLILFAAFVALISAVDNALYLTFPIAGVAYLLTTNLREHWHDAVMDGLDARRHVAGVVGWWLFKMVAFGAGLALFFWVLENWVGPGFVYIFDLIAGANALLEALPTPAWLENILIVILSLAGLGLLVFLQKRYEHAD